MVLGRLNLVTRGIATYMATGTDIDPDTPLLAV
jgi:hypothetical protein